MTISCETPRWWSSARPGFCFGKRHLAIKILPTLFGSCSRIPLYEKTCRRVCGNWPHGLRLKKWPGTFCRKSNPKKKLRSALSPDVGRRLSAASGSVRNAKILPISFHTQKVRRLPIYCILNDMTRERLSHLHAKYVRDSLNAAVEKGDLIHQLENELVVMLKEIDSNRLYVRAGFKSLRGFCLQSLRFSKTQSQRIVTRVRRYEPTSNIGGERSPGKG